MKEINTYIEIPVSGENIYSFFHLPTSSTVRANIIMVPPLGQEWNRIYRLASEMARQLVSEDVAVARFFHRGEGESNGRTESVSLIRTRVEDINLVAEKITKFTHCDNFYIVTFRLGTLFSLMAARKNRNIKKIYMCDPILDLKEYAGTLNRIHILLKRHYKKEHLSTGDSLIIYGYKYSRTFVSQLRKINLKQLFKTQTAEIWVRYFHRKDMNKNSKMHYYLNINENRLNAFDIKFTWGTNLSISTDISSVIRDLRNFV